MKFTFIVSCNGHHWISRLNVFPFFKRHYGNPLNHLHSDWIPPRLKVSCYKHAFVIPLCSEFYEACLDLAEKTDDTAFQVHCLVRKGQLYRDVGRVQDSENTLRDALTLCFSHLQGDSLETAKCYEG